MDGARSYVPARYAARFPSRVSQGIREWVTRRLGCDGDAPDALDSLIAASSRDWAAERVFLADGIATSNPLAPAEYVIEAIGKLRPKYPLWRTLRGAKRVSVNAFGLAEAGLISTLAGITQGEAALRLRLPRTTLQHRIDAHRQSLVTDPEYANRCARVARDILIRMGKEAGIEEGRRP